MLGGEDQLIPGTAPRHDNHLVGATLIQHCERVAHSCPPAAGPYIGGAVRTPVAAPVERHHPAVAGEVWDLELPRPGVDDFPGRQEQYGGLSRPLGLVVHPHPLTLDIAGLVPGTRPPPLARRCGPPSIPQSIPPGRSPCPVSMPARHP